MTNEIEQLAGEWPVIRERKAFRVGATAATIGERERLRKLIEERIKFWDDAVHELAKSKEAAMFLEGAKQEAHEIGLRTGTLSWVLTLLSGEPGNETKEG